MKSPGIYYISKSQVFWLGLYRRHFSESTTNQNPKEIEREFLCVFFVSWRRNDTKAPAPRPSLCEIKLKRYARIVWGWVIHFPSFDCCFWNFHFRLPDISLFLFHNNGKFHSSNTLCSIARKGTSYIYKVNLFNSIKIDESAVLGTYISRNS